jgi:hypothetical protein
LLEQILGAKERRLPQIGAGNVRAGGRFYQEAHCYTNVNSSEGMRAETPDFID